MHLVRTDAHRGRRDATIFVHGPVPGWAVEEVDGVRVVGPALAALQVAQSCGPEAGIVCLDGVLRRAEDQDLHDMGQRHGPSRASVIEQVDRLLHSSIMARTRHVSTVLDLMDGRSQSVGESRSRWLLHLLGFGRATPQFEVRDRTTLYGVVDLKLADHAVIVEFDGTTKYTGRGDLLAEKRREDQIRDLGYEVVRLTWSDLAHPRLVRQKILAAIARAQARSRVG
ncbi:hypothetical protein SAMN05421879_10647 [Ornithinimicrobium cerasi]|uniref:DUF559 domain-containing protein n=1 Tax=Ornithinimicrobium cerasi TaxID=2248773 RepID=A0A285VQH0_9MICO|nr:hypothetical protein SAMN05421879_10647 [Ornithinimicrobium cerasi]